MREKGRSQREVKMADSEDDDFFTAQMCNMREDLSEAIEDIGDEVHEQLHQLKEEVDEFEAPKQHLAYLCGGTALICHLIVVYGYSNLLLLILLHIILALACGWSSFFRYHPRGLYLFPGVVLGFYWLFDFMKPWTVLLLMQLSVVAFLLKHRTFFPIPPTAKRISSSPTRGAARHIAQMPGQTITPPSGHAANEIILICARWFITLFLIGYIVRWGLTLKIYAQVAIAIGLFVFMWRSMNLTAMVVTGLESLSRAVSTAFKIISSQVNRTVCSFHALLSEVVHSTVCTLQSVVSTVVLFLWRFLLVVSICIVLGSALLSFCDVYINNSSTSYFDSSRYSWITAIIRQYSWASEKSTSPSAVDATYSNRSDLTQWEL